MPDDDRAPARWKPVLAVLLAVAVAAGSAVLVVVALHRPAQRRPGHVAAPRATATPPPAAAQVLHATTLRARPRPTCAPVRHGFDPATVAVAGVTTGAAVVEPPRDANGIPGVPPLSSYGKVVFALDRAQGILPGDHAGNVLLNAHTWPDGSALGNRLLANVHRGSKIVVRGAGVRLCYHVTEEVEVLAADGLRATTRRTVLRSWRSWSARDSGWVRATGPTGRSGSPPRPGEWPARAQLRTTRWSRPGATRNASTRRTGPAPEPLAARRRRGTPRSSARRG